MSSSAGNVAIFWDYENCELPSHAVGYSVAGGIRDIAHKYGTIKIFKAYLETKEQTSPRALSIRSELISSGVSIIDCPHNGRKDVADKMLIVDMLAYAMDNPAPATIVLISGDGDFVHAVSLLRLRRYHVVIIAPTQNNMHLSMKHQASEIYDWCSDILPPTSPSSVPLNSRGGNLMPRIVSPPAAINIARPLRSAAAPFVPSSPTIARGDKSSSRQLPASELENDEVQDAPVRMYSSVAAGFSFDSFYANISAPCTPEGTSRELRQDHSSNSSISALPTPPDESHAPPGGTSTPPPEYLRTVSSTTSSSDCPTPSTPLRTLADPFVQLPSTLAEDIVTPSRTTTATPLISTASPAGGRRSQVLTVETRRNATSAIITANPPMHRLKEPPSKFNRLVKILEQRRLQGDTRITSSQLGEVLKPVDYMHGEITTLRKYTEAAEGAGIVILGEKQANGNRWIALHPTYHGKSRKSSGS